MRRGLLLLVLACTPPPARPASDGLCHDDSPGCALAAQRHYTNQMCACRDLACADRVHDELTRWGARVPRSREGSAHPTPDEAATGRALMQRYAECRAEAGSAATVR